MTSAVAEEEAPHEPVSEAGRASPVALDRGLCKACGICMDLCPKDVFETDQLGYPVVARPEACNSCLVCELHCPDLAIEIRRRPRPGAGGEDAATETVSPASEDG